MRNFYMTVNMGIVVAFPQCFQRFRLNTSSYRYMYEVMAITCVGFIENMITFHTFLKLSASLNMFYYPR